MIHRKLTEKISQLLEEFPAVGLLGPRQIGKTTLAEYLMEIRGDQSVYLDLENPSDLAKLQQPDAYFDLHKGKLIILDEIQRIPELFAPLRGIIDRRRKEGFRYGQFLLLGSASLDLLKQSSESLAGRIAYTELSAITLDEVEKTTETQNRLWLRGGFPDSLLAKNDASSMRWRINFINTFLERDVPLFGPRIPAVTLRRLWTMLAHNQGGQLNVAQLGASLDIAAPTTKRYIDLLSDLLLVRTLLPWSGNVGKRLVKTPKVYIRDSGIAHALLGIEQMDDLLGHPVVGASWEGFVIENLLAFIGTNASAWFYRTSAGAEIDLVVEIGQRERLAFEVKRSMAPTVSKGFHHGCEDIKATRKIVIYPGNEAFPLAQDITALPIHEAIATVRDSTN